MNPSSKGWIAKFYSHFVHLKVPEHSAQHYEQLREYGFLYGINVKLNGKIEAYHRYSEDELTKINLIYALSCEHSLEKETTSLADFASDIIEFYSFYHVARSAESKRYPSKSFLQKLQKFGQKSTGSKLLTGKKQLAKLEQTINERVGSEDIGFAKNHLQTIGKALLYIDVLSYELWKKKLSQVDSYAALMEQLALSVIFQSYKHKMNLSPFDSEIKALLKKLKVVDILNKEISIPSFLEKDDQFKSSRNYLFDLACRFSMHAHRFEATSLAFLQELAKILHISESTMRASMDFAVKFSMDHQKQIRQIENVNLISNIYDGSSQMVGKLIRRNSKRLIKEIRQSKELMYLLTKSTYTDLSKEEQKELQFQLIDILKTIPSLAIFLLPGGAILLPLFAKLIPNIIPSAFDDNRIDD